MWITWTIRLLNVNMALLEGGEFERLASLGVFVGDLARWFDFIDPTARVDLQMPWRMMTRVAFGAYKTTL